MDNNLPTKRWLMATYELTIAIPGAHARRGGEVRAWIDRNLSSNLGSERELKLKREQGRWSARFQLRAKDCKRFGVRVGLVAESGALWQVSIRDCAADRAVFEDSDVLADAKQWLLGTCDAVNHDVRLEHHPIATLHWLGHNV